MGRQGLKAGALMGGKSEKPYWPPELMKELSELAEYGSTWKQFQARPIQTQTRKRDHFSTAGQTLKEFKSRCNKSCVKTFMKKIIKHLRTLENVLSRFIFFKLIYKSNAILMWNLKGYFLNSWRKADVHKYPVQPWKSTHNRATCLSDMKT